MKDFLPMGSIVCLKASKKKLIIVGRQQKRTDKNEIYDYTALFYPFGSIDNQVVLFNETDIEELIFRGYCDIEEQEFVKFLNGEMQKQA